MKIFFRPLCVVLAVVALHVLISLSGVIPFVDNRLFDVISNVRATPISPDHSSTVVVEIDEKSLQDLGQWPWPRIILAKILQEIIAQQPAAVGLDIFFPEPDRTSPVQLRQFYSRVLGTDVELNSIPVGIQDHDLIFADILSRGPTVLPLFVSENSSDSSDCGGLSRYLLPLPDHLKINKSRYLLCNTPELQQAAQGFGFINASVDSDGILRRQPLILGFDQQGLPSLVLAMLAQVDPDIQIHAPDTFWKPVTISFANKTISVNEHGELLNTLYSKKQFKRISASALIRGDMPRNLFTGKMVLVGASAAGLYDHYITSSGETLPGVFAHASLMENILNDKSLYQPEISKRAALIISCILSTFIVCFVLRRYYILSSGFYLGISLSAVIVTTWLMEHGWYVSLGYFLVPFSLLFFCVSLFLAVLHYIERKRFLEDLEQAHSATIDSMTMVAESRDVETGAHIIRTKEYVAALAWTLYKNGHYQDKLNPASIDLLYRAAPLHDIGKVGIPDAILQKAGKLTDEEIQTMRTHVTIGHSIIENAINNYNKTNEFLMIASNMTFSHHEKWDGTGYPLGLKGEDIPLEGRLMALADVYDALISSRCYKAPIPFAEAEKMICRERGRHFDPLMVDAFYEQRDVFRKIARKCQDSRALKPADFSFGETGKDQTGKDQDHPPFDLSPFQVPPR